MNFSSLPLAKNQLPPAPSLRKLIGPSFIILGLGLGSGEVILWPYLASNFGLGIIWGALVGITFQFFINMEVERYALIYGESIFVGFARLFRWLPLWFIFSTFIGFGWPGIGLAGAQLLGDTFGFSNHRQLGIIIFISIGLILSLGKVLYSTVENLQKYLILFGVPFIFFLTIYLINQHDLVSLLLGLIGIGQLPAKQISVGITSPVQLSYYFLPLGISLTTFLGALAYSGAGGNLNLAQSFYVRDKGYGMGKYAAKITSIFRQKAVPKKPTAQLALTGSTFECNPKNLAQFKRWWRTINLEHLIVFWFLGLFTMLLLALLAFATTFGLSGIEKGIHFVNVEASIIAQRTIPILGSLFLLVAAAMLLSTQLGVLESTSRIITENLLLWRSSRGDTSPKQISQGFYLVLWAQIVFGILVFSLGFDEPRQLITLGATLNAWAMFVYIGLLLWLNNKVLAKPLRPSWLRNAVLIVAFLFFGVFSSLIALKTLAMI